MTDTDVYNADGDHLGEIHDVMLSGKIAYAVMAFGGFLDRRMVMAAGVMITVPALIFFLTVQRYLITGWGAGGVKG